MERFQILLLIFAAACALAAFCRAPRIDPTREEFAFRPETVAPPDRLSFRLRRFLARRLGGRS